MNDTQAIRLNAKPDPGIQLANRQPAPIITDF
jgi:hypothetical protein